MYLWNGFVRIPRTFYPGKINTFNRIHLNPSFRFRMNEILRTGLQIISYLCRHMYRLSKFHLLWIFPLVLFYNSINLHKIIVSLNTEESLEKFVMKNFAAVSRSSWDIDLNNKTVFKLNIFKPIRSILKYMLSI